MWHVDNAEEAAQEAVVLAHQGTDGLELADASELLYCPRSYSKGHTLFLYATLIFFVNQHIFGHCGHLLVHLADFMTLLNVVSHFHIYFFMWITSRFNKHLVDGNFFFFFPNQATTLFFKPQWNESSGTDTPSEYIVTIKWNICCDAHNNSKKVERVDISIPILYLIKLRLREVNWLAESSLRSPSSFSLHCMIMILLRSYHRVQPTSELEPMPSAFQFCTFKSTGYYKILCQGDFVFHDLFISEINAISVYEGLRMLSYRMIKNTK